MRQRFELNGLEGFAPHEALELLLFYAIPRRDVNPLAHQLLKHFGSLDAVLRAAPAQLAQIPGIGKSAAALIALVQPLFRYAERERQGEKPVLANYQDAKAFCAHLFAGKTDEVLYVISLDAQGRVLRSTPVTHGTIDEVAIYPRKIVGDALLHNAHAVVLAHNHPSGVAEPSEADLLATQRLRDAFAGVDILLMDHIIYGDGNCTSIKQWERMQQAVPLLRAEEERRAADKKRTGRGAQPKREAKKDQQ